jgi:hypothetical protein
MLGAWRCHGQVSVVCASYCPKYPLPSWRKLIVLNAERIALSLQQLIKTYAAAVNFSSAVGNITMRAALLLLFAAMLCSAAIIAASDTQGAEVTSTTRKPKRSKRDRDGKTNKGNRDDDHVPDKYHGHNDSKDKEVKG